MNNIKLYRYLRYLKGNIKTLLNKILEIEFGQKVQKEIETDEFLYLLLNIVDSLWTTSEPSGKSTFGHIRTSFHDKIAHWLLVQPRACLAYKNLYRLSGNEEYLIKAQSLGDYILLHQENNGLFLAHGAPNYPLDEGVATYWNSLALLELYELDKKDEYLEASVKVGEAGREYLYGENYGYEHTMGQEMWCLNVSIVAAFVYKLLYEFTGDDKYYKYCSDGLKVVLENITEYGMFPYTKKNQRVYYTLYHSLVTYFLLLFENTPWDEEWKITHKAYLAVEYLSCLVRKDGSVIEPELDGYVYAVSLAASAAVFSKVNDYDKSTKITRFLSKFRSHKNDKIYILEKNNKLYMGQRKEFWDSYTCVCFDWLMLALSYQSSKL